MTISLLSNLIARAVPMHAARLQAIMAAVQSVLGSDEDSSGSDSI